MLLCTLACLPEHFHLLYAGCNEADLIGTLNTASCADRGFVKSSYISGGVVCYNGTTEGSRAVYICNDGFVLMGNEATRICQSDGNWNGSMSHCFLEEPGMYVCSPLSIHIKLVHMLKCISAISFSVHCSLNLLLCT